MAVGLALYDLIFVSLATVLLYAVTCVVGVPVFAGVGAALDDQVSVAL